MTSHRPELAVPAPTRVLLGGDCFVVSAEALPTGVNQRPGVSLLLGRSAPLVAEVLGEGVRTGWALLLAPEQERRFVGVQAHYSITIEPGHSLYTSYLAWARQAQSEPWRARLAAPLPAALAPALDRLGTAPAFDDWLLAFSSAYDAPRHAAEPILLDLFATLRATEAALPDASAEDVWKRFRKGRPGDQAYWSRWLQAQIGISLRKLMLWRKMRRAIEAAAESRHATSVAHVAGFADSAHLSRICLRTLGVRPSDVQNHKSVQVVLLPPA